MRVLTAVVAVSLLAVTALVAHGAESQGWCGGAFTESEGSNFAPCVEGVSAMVSAETHAGPITKQFSEMEIQAGGGDGGE